MGLRYYSQKFFTKPLTYEYYLKEVKRFGNGDPLTLLKFIESNRNLQQTSRLTKNNFLGIKLPPSNNKLESQLVNLIDDFKGFANNHVMKTYINYNPKPTNISQLIKMVRKNFDYQISSCEQVDFSVLYNGLNLLLHQKDYYNGFRLIDETITTSDFVERMKKGLHFKLFLLLNISLTGVVSYFLPLFPLALIALTNLISTGLLWASQFLRYNKVEKLSWRSYNSWLYNLTHEPEILLVNKIITHYEEHNEVNIKNYHNSKVRHQSNINIFNQGDYYLELPTNLREMTFVNQEMKSISDQDQREILETSYSNQVLHQPDHQNLRETMGQENFKETLIHSRETFIKRSSRKQLEVYSGQLDKDHIDQSQVSLEQTPLQQHFRDQLYRRKLVYDEISDELIFLEYWLTNSNEFQWVEPDQDPAEILKLKVRNNINRST